MILPWLPGRTPLWSPSLSRFEQNLCRGIKFNGLPFASVGLPAGAKRKQYCPSEQLKSRNDGIGHFSRGSLAAQIVRQCRAGHENRLDSI